MFGLATGLAAGVLEYFLLRKYTARVLAGDMPMALLFMGAKLLVLLGVLLAVALIWRDQLVLAGAGVAVPLIALSVAQFARQHIRQKKERETHAE